MDGRFGAGGFGGEPSAGPIGPPGPPGPTVAGTAQGELLVAGPGAAFTMAPSAIPTFVDAGAYVRLVATSDLKTLTIQRFGGQTSNLFEIQNELGTAMASFDLFATPHFPDGTGGGNSQRVGAGSSAAALGTAFGVSAVALSSGVAIGYLSVNSSTNSVTVGENSSTGAFDSIAIGTDASTAATANSISIGRGASSAGGVAIGTTVVATAGTFVSGSDTRTITDVYFGAGITSDAPVDYTIHGTGGSSGFAINGAYLILAGGVGGTATDVGAGIVFQTARTADGTLLVTAGSIDGPTGCISFPMPGALGNHTERFGVETGIANTTGTDNCFFGYQAGKANTTGTDNNAYGSQSLLLVTTGSANNAFGAYSLGSLTTGDSNSAFGETALFHCTTGVSNTAVGDSALKATTTANNNSAFGYFALNQNTGTENSAFGNISLQSNTSGNFNAAFGSNSLGPSISGSNNSGFGYACGAALTTGSDCTLLGHSANVDSGARSNVVVIGSDAVCTAANQFVSGSSTATMTDVYFGKGVSNATPTAYTIHGTGGTGAAVAGAALNLAGGISGDAATGGGNVVIQTSLTGTGTTLTNAIYVEGPTGRVGINTTPGAFQLDVNGDTRVTGKLTVTGAIDPTSVLLSGGTALFYESNDGSTAPVSGAATGRIRYNNAGAGTWQISTQTGAYSNIITSATLPSSTWNSITAPTGNLSLAMAAFTTTFTWNATTGAGVNLFNLTDTAANTGTGVILRVGTAATSAATPFQVFAKGTNSFTVEVAGSVTCPGAGASSERFGSGSLAGGSSSLAVGNAATSVGASSTAVGKDASSSGTAATAVGTSSTASGTRSGVFGQAASDGGFTAYVFGAGGTATADGQCLIGATASCSITDLYLGQGVASTTAPAALIHATGGSGLNNAGGSLTLAGGKSTGTVTGGSVIVQVAAPGASSSSLNALGTAFTIAAQTGGTTAVVNGLTLTGSRTGQTVTLAATGTDTNITTAIDSKGTGTLILNGTSTSNVGIGITPTQTLHVQTPSVAGTAEVIAQFQVSDATTEFLQIVNNTSVDGKFVPSIVGHSNSTTDNGLVLVGETTAGADTGVVPMIVLQAKRSTGAAVTSRDILTIQNFSTEIIHIPNNGNLVLGSGEAGATPVGNTFRGPNAAGTNITGAGLTVAGGVGTGTGVGGSLVFQVSAPVASGSTVGTLGTALTIAPQTGGTTAIVNGLTLTASRTGQDVRLDATGSDTNITWDIRNKGTGNITFTMGGAEQLRIDGGSNRIVLNNGNASTAFKASMTIGWQSASNSASGFCLSAANKFAQSPTAGSVTSIGCDDLGTTVMAANNRLGIYAFGGRDNTGTAASAYLTTACGMSGFASETWSLTANGSYLTFSTIANTTTTLTERMRIDNAGNVLIGGTAAGTSAVAALVMKNGTAPSTSPADSIQLYAEDVAASSELKVRDEAGNITVLSPHNFSLTQKSEAMAWSHYSENTAIKQRVNVDMMKLCRLVEKLSGEILVHIEELR